MALLIPRYTDEEIDPRRRALLIAALQAGLLGIAVAPLIGRRADAAILGKAPGKLPVDRSIYSVTGPTAVNGAAADLGTLIKPGDTVETGPGGRIIFVVEDNAHILRENSRVELAGGIDAAAALRVFTGVLLSVFGRRKRRLVTATATIGIPRYRGLHRIGSGRIVYLYLLWHGGPHPLRIQRDRGNGRL